MASVTECQAGGTGHTHDGSGGFAAPFTGKPQVGGQEHNCTNDKAFYATIAADDRLYKEFTATMDDLRKHEDEQDRVLASDMSAKDKCYYMAMMTPYVIKARKTVLPP